MRVKLEGHNLDHALHDQAEGLCLEPQSQRQATE